MQVIRLILAGTLTLTLGPDGSAAASLVPSA
jgi:hypothetical protein